MLVRRLNSPCRPVPCPPSPRPVNFLDLKIFHPLGEGSFGRVYLASYYETLVAIKILVSFDEKELEAQAAANLLSLSSPILAALNKEASLLASLR